MDNFTSPPTVIPQSIESDPEEGEGGQVERVIGNQTSGFKSRPRNCSFTLVALRSSAWAIMCCKFREGKTVVIGMPITRHLSRRSQRARLTRWDSISGSGVKTLERPWMQDTYRWEENVPQRRPNRAQVIRLRWLRRRRLRIHSRPTW